MYQRNGDDGEMMTDNLLTTQQVMSRLQIADETIYRYIRQGRLKAIRVGGLWRIPEEALQEFLGKGERAIKEGT